MPAYPPSRIEVVSPTRVAAPCRLDDTAIAIIIPTGLIFSLREISRAIGAIMSTVATLSIKAETIPANRDSDTMVHFTLGTFSRMMSAISAGILDSISRDTMPIVPAIIIRTL